ncbi:putative fatty acyl-CoA reductase CG5065 [Onthophagus taurus]|uniref:putative fatty acyl-CoA reductase CG5065 n=1 Tax=Onthophagus taurus TaxID=166361 RepID=UPI0039BE5B9C
MSPITEFYSEKTIFITGATGYMGKVLLEKLVRSLPEIKKIYILLRPKKGCSPQERLKKLTDDVIFTFHDMNAKAYDKIEVISGDVSKENFELSEVDKKKLIEEVSIVFHLAACVRMDLPLKEAVITNTKSTYQLFKFCVNMKALKSVVHLSTAFCNVEIMNAEEKIYSMDLDPYKIIDLVEWMDDKSLNNITKRLLGPHPNTYTFTKRLSEMIAMDMNDKIPLIISRPSIVFPAIKEPIPGWVDNLNGPIGLFYAGGKGIVRSGIIDENLVPQIIPVDVAINSLIVSGYERATNMYCDRVINVSCGDVLRPTWRDMFVTFQYLAIKYPYKLILWYPKPHLTTSYYLYIINVILFQILPAIIIDFLLIIFLQKPFLINIQKRLLLTWKVLRPFTTKKWIFSNTNFLKLHEKLNTYDSNVFYIIENFEENKFRKYCKDCFKTANKYLLKETLENLSLYRIRNKILFVLDLLIKVFFIYFVLKWIFVKHF